MKRESRLHDLTGCKVWIVPRFGRQSQHLTHEITPFLTLLRGQKPCLGECNRSFLLGGSNAQLFVRTSPAARPSEPAIRPDLDLDLQC